MITIPVVRTETPDGELLSPAQPIPPEAIAVICDGMNYFAFQPGDKLTGQA